MEATMTSFCEMMEEMAEADFTTMPNYITLVAIRDELSGKIPSRIIDKLLMSMKIDVDQGFVSNEELFNRAIRGFCKVTIKFYETLLEEFGDEMIIISRASDLELKARGLEPC